MTEITLNSKTPSLVKVLIATKEEQLNYGITGGIIDRATFNKLKALVEREDENCGDKKEITVLDTIKDIGNEENILLTVSVAISAEGDNEKEKYKFCKNYWGKNLLTNGK